MDNKDFVKVAANNSFTKNFVGFLDEDYFFELAKKHEKIIVYANCNGGGFVINGFINTDIDNGGLKPTMDVLAFKDGDLFDLHEISEDYTEMCNYIKKNNLLSIHFKKTNSDYQYRLLKSDIPHERIIFFNLDGYILTRGIIFNISDIA